MPRDSAQGSGFWQPAPEVSRTPRASLEARMRAMPSEMRMHFRITFDARLAYSETEPVSKTSKIADNLHHPLYSTIVFNLEMFGNPPQNVDFCCNAGKCFYMKSKLVAICPQIRLSELRPVRLFWHPRLFTLLHKCLMIVLIKRLQRQNLDKHI